MSDEIVETTKKPRAPRRTATLVVGHWSADGAFVPAPIQPTGKASTKVESLRAWLRQPAVAEQMSAVLAGVLIATIRKGPVEHHEPEMSRGSAGYAPLPAE